LKTLLRATYLGGSGFDFGGDLTIGSNGNVYVTGSTNTGATPFPTTAGAYQTTTTQGAGFVSILTPDLTSLVASTIVGVCTSGAYFWGIALDSSSNVFITGSINNCSTYPQPAGYGNTNSGFGISITTKFNPTLTTVLASAGIRTATKTTAGLAGMEHNNDILI